MREWNTVKINFKEGKLRHLKNTALFKKKTQIAYQNEIHKQGEGKMKELDRSSVKTEERKQIRCCLDFNQG